MKIEGYDEEILDEEAVIEDVLGDHPRARELRLMRAALEQRLAQMQRERARTASNPAQSDLDTRIAETRKQIAALRQEEAITGFVEGSVRATLHRTAAEDLY